MRVVLSDRAVDALREAPQSVRRAFNKQLRFLAKNLNHPSLQAKKYNKALDLWQGRLSGDWRFYFTVEKATYRIEDVIPNPK